MWTLKTTKFLYLCYTFFQCLLNYLDLLRIWVRIIGLSRRWLVLEKDGGLFHVNYCYFKLLCVSEGTYVFWRFDGGNSGFWAVRYVAFFHTLWSYLGLTFGWWCLVWSGTNVRSPRFVLLLYMLFGILNIWIRWVRWCRGAL